jgi:hypothetical protein
MLVNSKNWNAASWDKNGNAASWNAASWNAESFERGRPVVSVLNSKTLRVDVISVSRAAILRFR